MLRIFTFRLLAIVPVGTSLVASVPLPVAKADITYEELAKRLEPHGFKENSARIANKLARGTFAATWFLAVLAALELEGVRLEDL